MGEAEDLVRELAEALKEARSDAVFRWCMEAGRLGVGGAYPELVARHGVPEHIAKLDTALEAAQAYLDPRG